MRKPYNIVYLVLMLIFGIYIIFNYDSNDNVTMIFAAIIFILTSIFTYSNRKK